MCRRTSSGLLLSTSTTRLSVISSRAKWINLTLIIHRQTSVHSHQGFTILESSYKPVIFNLWKSWRTMLSNQIYQWGKILSVAWDHVIHVLDFLYFITKLYCLQSTLMKLFTKKNRTENMCKQAKYTDSIQHSMFAYKDLLKLPTKI